MSHSSPKKNTHDIIGKRYFVVHESIFKRKIHVFLNFTSKQFDTFAANHWKAQVTETREYDDNFCAFSSTKTEQGRPDEFIICQQRFNWTIDDQATLVHEIVHTIIKIFVSNNIPYNQETQEFLAHDIGNLYADICGKIFRKKKIKR